MIAKAAYAPSDPRAIQPGPSAEDAPDPPRPSERRIIGSGPLVLTRAALSYWERFRVLPEERHAEFARAVDRETATVLAQLKRNLAELGPFREWWVPHLKSNYAPRLKPGVPELLLRGLLLDLRHLKALLQQLPVMLDTREKVFVQAMEAMGRVEVLRREEKVDEMATVRERVTEEIDRRQVDLREAVPTPLKREVAKAAGTSPELVQQVLCTLRKDRGIPTPQRGWTTKPHVSRSDQNGHAAPAGKPLESEDLPVSKDADFDIRIPNTEPEPTPDSNVEKSSPSLADLPPLGPMQGAHFVEVHLEESQCGNCASYPCPPTNDVSIDVTCLQCLRNLAHKRKLDYLSMRDELARVRELLAAETAAREVAESKCRELEAELAQVRRNATRFIHLVNDGSMKAICGEPSALIDVMERTKSPQETTCPTCLHEELLATREMLEKSAETLRQNNEVHYHGLAALKRVHNLAIGGAEPPEYVPALEADLTATINEMTRRLMMKDPAESPLVRLMLAAGRVENGQRETIIRAACEIVEGRVAA